MKCPKIYLVVWNDHEFTEILRWAFNEDEAYAWAQEHQPHEFGYSVEEVLPLSHEDEENDE